MVKSELKRAKKGEGEIRERSPGKWEARIRVNGQRKSFYGNSEKEVTKKLKEFKLKLAGGVSQHKKVSYSDFMQTWLDRKKLQVKEQSFHRIESTYKVHIEPAIGYFVIDKIDSKLIQDELINEKIKTLSHSSVKKIYDVLNSSFKYARSTGYLASNPVDLVILPQKTHMVFDRDKKPGGGNLEILTDGEVKRLTEAAMAVHSNGEPVYPNGRMFLLMLYTGLRVGEASALRWSDFDETSHNLTVSSNIIRTKDEDGKAVFKYQKSVKTKSSHRILKLNQQALEIISPFKKSGYIFCNRHGEVLRPRNIQNTLDAILQRAGIPHKSTHVFRHTFASKLFEQGVDVKIVSELLGHSSVSFTYNIYITLIQKQKVQAIESIKYFD